ncbi:phosphotransferase family protein [Nitrosovibrio tenuis]|uniref:Phosphotransferase enzyme family protein n=1 Tax=Nitrosovibrio tenuis TaxID=1233 RepID=A0A1H7MCJ3_9PROT|nr:phosphotransferase [Nitrosovibrio tenuis]SEL08892.1 Phosphotransferase enzyme family protein [Nitrosovibrio tenuis]
MNYKYLGHLSQDDPFYGYLQHDIIPVLGVNLNSPDFRVYRLPSSNHVYLYEDSHSQLRIIGKFFGGVPLFGPEAALHHMEREYNNLNYLRSIGFAGYPHYVVRPLGRNAHLNKVLVEEYCYGTSLAEFIVRAISEGERDALFQKLGSLAYFLATLHNRTARDSTVDFNKDCEYFDRLLEHLAGTGRLGQDEVREFHGFRDRWREKPCMWEDREVLAHSDVTPANVLFGDGLWVIVIDLERMKLADRVLDVGRVVGELQHYFLKHAHDRWLAEPFIGHFLWEYACHFPNRDAAFASITRRIPFYAGLTLLRIARNSWINDHYSRLLLDDAKKMLR